MHKYSAKRLTFIYFSIVAFSIIIVHGLVIDSTLDSIEQLLAQQQIVGVKDIVLNTLDNTTQKK